MYCMKEKVGWGQPAEYDDYDDATARNIKSDPVCPPSSPRPRIIERKSDLCGASWHAHHVFFFSLVGLHRGSFIQDRAPSLYGPWWVVVFGNQEEVNCWQSCHVVSIEQDG